LKLTQFKPIIALKVRILKKRKEFFPGTSGIDGYIEPKDAG
jgi:hypothetical protein